MHTTRTFLISAVTATAAMAAVAVPLAGSAAATPAERAPRAAKFCLYENRDFNFWSSGSSSCYNAGTHNLTQPLDNDASSMENNTATTLCAFTGKDRGGHQIAVGSQHYFKNLSYDTAPDGGSWNDRISSIGKCR